MLGIQTPTDAEVLSGLNEGDMVVVYAPVGTAGPSPGGGGNGNATASNGPVPNGPLPAPPVPDLLP